MKNKYLSSIFGAAAQTAPISVTNETLFGDDKARTMEFVYYNGFAFCPNFEGKSYYFEYPLLSCFTDDNQETKEILVNSELESSKDIRPYDVALIYGEIKEYGEAVAQNVEEFLFADKKKSEEETENENDDASKLPTTAITTTQQHDDIPF